MSFDLWLGVVAASAALLLVPGPTVILVPSNALSRGRGIALDIVVPVRVQRAGGGALIAMGALTATLRRAA